MIYLIIWTAIVSYLVIGAIAASACLEGFRATRYLVLAWILMTLFWLPWLLCVLAKEKLESAA